MGKSGWLPDVSSNFFFYRTLAINSLQKRDYNSAAAALYDLNGCLGEDYLITINTETYNQAMANQEVYICNHCTMDQNKTINKGEENEYVKVVQVPRELPTNTVKILSVISPFIESVLTGSDTELVWYCPVCKEENKVRETRKIVPLRERPFFLKVVPECPVRGDGISNRMGFDELFNNWFQNLLEEINWQEVLYRKEYVAQHEGEDMDTRSGGGND
jgi:hypothetical protein